MEDLLEGHDKFEGVGFLGAGAYGKVMLAKERATGKHVAIKFLQRGPEFVTRHFQREILAQSCLRHPHVVHLNSVFLTSTHLCIVLEYMSGGDLLKLCRKTGPVPELHARSYMQQIFVALHYCHEMGVVNRDVKLENVFLSANKQTIKLGDFGFAKGPWDSLPDSNVGTPNYQAPEVLLAPQQYDGKQADCWSCAVALYCMLFHSYPFCRAGDPKGSEGDKLVVARTLKADYIIPDSPRVSDACKDFLRSCLKVEPQERLTLEEILNHNWFLPGFSVQAMSFNRQKLLNSGASQSLMEQMKHIVDQARQPLDEPGQHPGFDLDKELDRQISTAVQSA